MCGAFVGLSGLVDDSLATGGVAYEAAPPRVAKGMARHPIPVMLLGRLATLEINFRP
jgi:hypothetical protein